MGLLEWSAVSFGLAILGGVAMLGWRLRTGTNPPLALAVPHGLAAATGLVLLATEVMGSRRGGAALAALIAFGCTAATGFAFLYVDKVKKRLLHVHVFLVKALVALTSLYFLVLALQGQ
jgi:hypothetical protein